MKKKSSYNEEPDETGSASTQEGEACQKYDTIWLCGSPKEVKRVLTLLKEQEETTTETSPDNPEKSEYCEIFEDEDEDREESEDDS